MQSSRSSATTKWNKVYLTKLDTLCSQIVTSLVSTKACKVNSASKMERINTEVDSKIVAELVKLGITSSSTLKPFHPRVRDDPKLAVLRCTSSGIIVLSRTDHVTAKSTYEDNTNFKYWGEKVSTRRQSALKCLEDDSRRAKMIEPLVTGKKWLDIGTGAGGILDLAADKAAVSVACEPQSAAREAMEKDGYKVYSYVSDVPLNRNDSLLFDVVTLFHVLEHLLDPVGVLRDAHDRMAVGGTCIVEVPHARDFLLDFLDFEPFKDFTLWSEHLVLCTRDSLKTVMEAAGFKDVAVKGIQRYPVANHLHWLRHGNPGGHQKWSHLRDEKLDQAYEDMLGKIDATDTIVAYGKKL